MESKAGAHSARYAHPLIAKKVYLFLLWLIKRKEMHGYEIIKVLKNDGMHLMCPSRLYPLLNSMLQEGLILQKEKRQGRRIKKVYMLTKKGERELAEGKDAFRGLVREFLEEMLK